MDPLTTPGVVPAAGTVLKSWAAEKGVILLSFAEVEAMGRATPYPVRPPKPEDIATLCYTSGTTGNPKFVLNRDLGVSKRQHTRNYLVITQ